MQRPKWLRLREGGRPTGCRGGHPQIGRVCTLNTPVVGGSLAHAVLSAIHIHAQSVTNTTAATAWEPCRRCCTTCRCTRDGPGALECDARAAAACVGVGGAKRQNVNVYMYIHACTVVVARTTPVLSRAFPVCWHACMRTHTIGQLRQPAPARK